MDKKRPPAIDDVRIGAGMRLKAAREGAGYTQQAIADKYGIKKGTVSAWEKGRGDPGIYRLRELSKLYQVSTDAILWEDSLTPDAMKVAADFDQLTEKQKSTLMALWMAYVQASAEDAKVEEKMPITQPLKLIQYQDNEEKK